MKSHFLPKLLLQVILSISFTFALSAQTYVAFLDYTGGPASPCTSGEGCDGNLTGNEDVTYDCIFSGSTSSGGNLSASSFADPVMPINPALESVIEFTVTLFGVGNPGVDVTCTLNGTLIQTVVSPFTAFGCEAACQSVSFTLTDLSGIPGYVYSGNNLLEISATATGSMCAFYAEIDILTGVPLPVELQSFTAKQKGYINTLSWQTATEIDNEGFYIERSTDGKGWKEIGFVAGAGTSFTGEKYQHADMAPLKGINYYRLVQMDYNGQVEISQVVSVNYKMSEETAFSIFPNPSHTGKVNMNYTSNINEEVSIRIYSLTGELLIHEIRSVVDGTNNLSFDLSEIGTGLFVVKMDNRDQPFVQKLLIR